MFTLWIVSKAFRQVPKFRIQSAGQNLILHAKYHSKINEKMYAREKI